jgi:hypothetical protein
MFFLGVKHFETTNHFETTISAGRQAKMNKIVGPQSVSSGNPLVI